MSELTVTELALYNTKVFKNHSPEQKWIKKGSLGAPFVILYGKDQLTMIS